MTEKNNGLLKLITTIIVSGVAGTLITVGIVYATLCGGVDSNKEEIKTMKPTVTSNREAIIKIEMKVEQLLTEQRKMVENFEQLKKASNTNTSAIIKAIRELEVNDGN